MILPEPLFDNAFWSNESRADLTPFHDAKVLGVIGEGERRFWPEQGGDAVFLIVGDAVDQGARAVSFFDAVAVGVIGEAVAQGALRAVLADFVQAVAGVVVEVVQGAGAGGEGFAVAHRVVGIGGGVVVLGERDAQGLLDGLGDVAHGVAGVGARNGQLVPGADVGQLHQAVVGVVFVVGGVALHDGFVAQSVVGAGCAGSNSQFKP